jgi:hypothetical protein
MLTNNDKFRSGRLKKQRKTVITKIGLGSHRSSAERNRLTYAPRIGKESMIALFTRSSPIGSLTAGNYDH